MQGAANLDQEQGIGSWSRLYPLVQPQNLKGHHMLGSIISAGSSLLGGLLGKSSADKQMKMQTKFAKNGIQWRVEDAKKAGIHPLAALGASTSAYSPINNGFGDAVAQAGNALGQEASAQAERKRQEPLTSLNSKLIASSIDTNQAQAELYRAQALSTAAQARNQAQGAVGGLNGDVKPMYIRVADPRNPKEIKWVINPDIVSEIGESAGTEFFAQPDGPVKSKKGDRARSGFGTYVKDQATMPKVRKLPKDEWSWWPSINW